MLFDTGSAIAKIQRFLLLAALARKLDRNLGIGVQNRMEFRKGEFVRVARPLPLFLPASRQASSSCRTRTAFGL